MMMGKDGEDKRREAEGWRDEVEGSDLRECVTVRLFRWPKV